MVHVPVPEAYTEKRSLFHRRREDADSLNLLHDPFREDSGS